MKKSHTLALLVIALFAATLFAQEGVVVGKRFQRAEPDYYRLGDAYTLEVEMTKPNGKRVFKNLLVSQQEWERYKVGDRYTGKKRAPVFFAQPSPTEAAEATPAPKKAKKPAATPTPKPKETPKQSPTPAASATPISVATPMPMPVVKPTPTPQPTPTAKPSATPLPSATPRATATPMPMASARPSVIPKATPVPSAKPKPTATPMPAASARASASPQPTTKPLPTLAPAEEQAAFDKVRAKALEDRGIRELKDKIHSARSDDEQRKASETYFKALYGKMRELAPPVLKPRIDAEESNALKKISAP